MMFASFLDRDQLLKERICSYRSKSSSLRTLSFRKTYAVQGTKEEGQIVLLLCKKRKNMAVYTHTTTLHRISVYPDQDAHISIRCIMLNDLTTPLPTEISSGKVRSYYDTTSSSPTISLRDTSDSVRCVGFPYTMQLIVCTHSGFYKVIWRRGLDRCSI